MKPWIDAAHKNNMKYLRVNMGHSIGLFRSDKLENLILTFKPILEYMESQGMTFVFENHGGKSSNIDFQLKVKERLPSKNFGYLLDCGNYRPKILFIHHPKLANQFWLSIKMYNFDENGINYLGLPQDHKKC